MTERDKAPGRGEAPEAASDKIHRLDTRQAELGQDLRRLFAELLDEDVPADLAALGAELEAKLAANERGGPGGGDSGGDPEP